MPLQLYDRVALRASFPEQALRAGDVTTLVDFVDHPSSGPRGCVLEFFNALGESIGVVTVPEDAVELAAGRITCRPFRSRVAGHVQLGPSPACVSGVRADASVSCSLHRQCPVTLVAGQRFEPAHWPSSRGTPCDY